MELSRDVFAAIAMHALLSKQGPGGYDFDIHNADSLRLACWSFDAADEMLFVKDASEEEIAKKFKTLHKKAQ